MAKQAKRQLAGSGEAIPSGAIGEVIDLSSAATSVPYATSTNVDTTVAPPKGLYIVTGQVGFSFTATPTVANYNIAEIQSSNFFTPGWYATTIPQKPNISNATVGTGVCGYFAADGTTKLRITANTFSGNSLTATVTMTLKLIRIA